VDGAWEVSLQRTSERRKLLLVTTLPEELRPPVLKTSLRPARRLQIPLADANRSGDAGDRQAAVILQAVINHRAETIIVNELGFACDARTARSIARRGAQLIATAHGSSLRDIVLNADLACLIGDLHTVLLAPEGIERCGAGLPHHPGAHRSAGV
jgi:hypothetical protein